LCGLPLNCHKTVGSGYLPSYAISWKLLAVFVPRSLLLTARLDAGQKVQIIPLSGAASTSKPPLGLPSLRQAKDAGTIRLKEMDRLPPNFTDHTHESKQKDWLGLLLREFLGLFLSCMRCTYCSLAYISGKFCIHSRPQIHHMCTNRGSDI
jgi:hypothetical protein